MKISSFEGIYIYIYKWNLTQQIGGHFFFMVYNYFSMVNQERKPKENNRIKQRYKEICLICQSPNQIPIIR